MAITGDGSNISQPPWIRASVSDDAFRREQEAFETLWIFVGFLSDIPDDGDWFRTTVGTKSIFVQRFGEEARAFENRCAHRFYPLRTSDRGNGPIVCEFHHWRYNKDGAAVGIPRCEEMYGTIPRHLNASIRRFEVDCCGALIFVRLSPPARPETLKEFLGEGFAIIEALCSPKTRPLRYTLPVRAHWKFLHHVSLDDYHIVAVHPDSFGKGGYLDPGAVQYRRFGRHSLFVASRAMDDLSAVADSCRNGTYRPGQYAICNIFPNFLVAQVHAAQLFGVRNWYVVVTRYAPVARDSCEAQVWLYKAPFPTAGGRLARFAQPVIDRILPFLVVRRARKVMTEDNVICEGQQRAAHQVDGEQILSAHEQRIGWFEEVYRDMLAGGDGRIAPGGK